MDIGKLKPLLKKFQLYTNNVKAKMSFGKKPRIQFDMRMCESQNQLLFAVTRGHHFDFYQAGTFGVNSLNSLKHH